MGDMIEFFQDMKAHRRLMRERFGVPCPKCNVKQPKRTPSILIPGQRCRVDGYRDPRPEVDENGLPPPARTGDD